MAAIPESAPLTDDAPPISAADVQLAAPSAEGRPVTLDLASWELVGRHDSRDALEKKRKAAAARIDSAAAAFKAITSTGAVLAGDARTLSDALADIYLALIESKAGIQTAQKLPHVRCPGAERQVPRSFALAEAYLQAAGYLFDERSFAGCIAEVQENQSLEMFEVWNLKAFLELVLLEEMSNALSADEAPTAGRASDLSAPHQISISSLVNSLQRILELDWKRFFESIAETEQILRSDPQGEYVRMDFETREAYRAAVSEFAKHSSCSEPEVARKAISLADSAQRSASPNRGARDERRMHVGYYLVEAGQTQLRSLIGYRPPLGRRIRETVWRWPDYFYFVGIEVITLAAVILLMTLSHAKTPGILAVALFLVPALECAIAAVNLVAATIFRPQRLPRLDFSKGIPRDCATVVVVPTLLSSEEQVRRAVRGLEIRFLANRDANLHFTLLTDCPDSTRQFDDKDHLAGLCSGLIQKLNDTYGLEGKGSFSHLHRHRTYNPVEEVWMGWERKRGKLLDFNRFLLKQGDAFPIKAGNWASLSKIRYVITLDLDTQLPRDAGHRLVATLAHPLNRAVIDPRSNTVVEGYGILQPRVDISVRSASRSRFASLLSGDTGFDVYTRAVSDVYQDLFDAGIFTGKGIYEVRTFQKVLEHTFPDNAVLSHDLIEGEYVRTGLVSDIEVVDDYPSHLSAFARRKHRWMRGDWQIIFALSPLVRNFFGRFVRNPLNHVSRWKIVDNLRRSLTDFAIFLLLLCGWFAPRPVSVYWTLAALAILVFPAYFQCAFSILTAGTGLLTRDFWKNLCADFLAAHATILFRLAFLCYQSLVALDAVVRTIVRMRVTRKKLLEWETASDAEQAGDEARHLVDTYMVWTFPLSLALALSISIVQPSALLVALPLLALWGSSALICNWLNKPRNVGEVRLDAADEPLVRNIALRTWRFFREFSNESENWLIPDIVRETPSLVAHHVSPTNLGLLLNSRLAALDLGFLTLPEFIRDLERTMATAERMPKFRGHFYNWYDTRTLKPIEPLFISTVDNGNLLSCLWTLKQGCLNAIEQPLFRPALWDGIISHLDLLVELLRSEKADAETVSAACQLRDRAIALAGPDKMRFDRLENLKIDAAIFIDKLEKGCPFEEVMSWGREYSLRVSNLASMMSEYAPWLLARVAKSLPSDLHDGNIFNQLSLDSASSIYREASQKLCESHSALREALHSAARNSEKTANRLRALAAIAETMIREMRFDFLYNPKKKMLSIGYDAGEGRLSQCHYDLLPSEARAAVFGAIAKSDIPQESWFELRRMYTKCGHEPVLRSWTGTAFEYLMPNLWFKLYPNTLLDHAASASLRAQQKFARRHRIPWGISECSCNDELPDGHYRYHAFGVPGLALNRGSSSDDLVVSPYSTFLGLLVDPRRAIRNIRKMKSLGWLSRFGFYESADFTPSRVNNGGTHEIVCNWMAHHQGMILVAAANALCDSVMQERFHAEPCVAATERILQEKRPRVVTIEKDAGMIPERAAAPGGHLLEALQHPEFRDLVPGLP
ncbi:MAG TPA: glucoamylase family protein [Candidatus Acidoferrum sp.]|nr:glucoamylase family protein [Candidatus Acidoferrum sp.]